MEKEKSCGAVVINDRNEVLLVKTVKGFYGFPKGHVEAGEKEEETAIREVKEETNVDIDIIDDKKFLLSYKVDGIIEKDVILFIARPISNNLKKQESEIKEVSWVAIDRVNSYFEFDNIKDLWNSKIKPYIINLNR